MFISLQFIESHEGKEKREISEQACQIFYGYNEQFSSILVIE